ncbi:MAG: phage protease [Sulfurimicrobium sp.]|nr:phage protease [Sulfurimicrobium sp.]
MTQRIAILSFDLPAAGKAVRLLPAGQFRSADGSGRPDDVTAWHIDAGQAAQLIARANARSDSKVIDYEHQTIRAGSNGQPAPAAGWIGSMEWRDDGLYITPDWTDKAAAMIVAREYRYISPVFTYDKNGNVLDLLHAGLTNFAGLDGLTDLAALSAHFKLEQEQPMKLLLAALGLAENTTEDKAIEAVAALKAQADGAETRIATLTAQAAQAPDPAKYVPMATHSQTQNALAALTAEFEKKERDTLMEVALSDGRILAAQDAYWRAQPVAALKAYLEVAHPVAALAGTQTGGKKPDGEEGSTLDAAQIAVCSAMGTDPKAFAKTASSM